MKAARNYRYLQVRLSIRPRLKTPIERAKALVASGRSAVICCQQDVALFSALRGSILTTLNYRLSNTRQRCAHHYAAEWVPVIFWMACVSRCCRVSDGAVSQWRDSRSRQKVSIIVTSAFTQSHKQTLTTAARHLTPNIYRLDEPAVRGCQILEMTHTPNAHGHWNNVLK